MAYYKQIRSRRTRGRVITSMAHTTKGGSGRIKRRPAYKKGMSGKKATTHHRKKATGIFDF